MIARVLLDHGVFLGDDMADGFLDSVSWYQRFVVPLLASRHFPDRIDHVDDEALLGDAHARLDDTWRAFRRDSAPAAAWGWKFPETLFAMPLVKRLFPRARFIHVVRHVLDVCLSDNGFFQLTGSHLDPPGWCPASVDGRRPTYVEFCTAVTFGDPRVREWHGFDLRDRAMLTRHRFLLQAQSWIACVELARRHGAMMGSDYLELRYEDFCSAPQAEASRLLSFIGAAASRPTKRSLDRVRPDRLERWRRAPLTLGERRDLARAAEVAASLAGALGYSL